MRQQFRIEPQMLLLFHNGRTDIRELHCRKGVPDAAIGSLDSFQLRGMSRARQVRNISANRRVPKEMCKARSHGW